MADDRVGADAEGVRVFFDFPQIFAPQALGRELDWGQRVLDLVGDAAGDIGPSRLALRRQQLGDVVEGDDKTADIAPVMLGGDAHQQGARAVAADQLHLRLSQPVRTAFRLVCHAHLQPHTLAQLEDQRVDFDGSDRSQ